MLLKRNDKCLKASVKHFDYIFSKFRELLIKNSLDTCFDYASIYLNQLLLEVDYPSPYIDVTLFSTEKTFKPLLSPITSQRLNKE